MDYEQLRQDLMDYYGTAMHSGFPMAVIDLSGVESANRVAINEIIIKA